MSIERESESPGQPGTESSGHAGAESRVRVAVLFGGRSGEHSVSCVSAASVLAELDTALFDITAIGVTRDGQWRVVDPATVAALTSGSGRALPEVGEGTEVALRNDVVSPAVALRDPGNALSTSIAASLDVDVVFPLLHGPFGEDGTVQGLLELAAIPYVGPGVLASAAAMDKEFTKRLLASAGLSVAPSVVLRPGYDDVSAADRERLGLPVFVKPARAGSSLGVSRVDDWSDLDVAVAAARDHDPKVLVESAIAGREVECGVLEFPDGAVRASPTAEIRVADERFYDFDAKYLDDDVATFDLPANIPPDVEKRVQETAIRAFRALDAQGLARVDFFVTDEGGIIVNEVNTMPGFTPISMFPRMWQEAGLSYSELLTTLVHTALARGTGLR